MTPALFYWVGEIGKEDNRNYLCCSCVTIILMKEIFENKTNRFVAVAVVCVLAVTFALYSTTFVDSSGDIYMPEIQTRVSVPDAVSLYFVTVGDEIVFTNDVMLFEEAQAHCDSVAYNTDNMWKQVVCTYDDVELYNDIFIAG